MYLVYCLVFFYLCLVCFVCSVPERYIRVLFILIRGQFIFRYCISSNLVDTEFSMPYIQTRAADRKAIEALNSIPVEKTSAISEKKSVKSTKSKSSSSSFGDSNKSVTSEMARERASLQIEAKFLKQKQLMREESKAFQLNLAMTKTRQKTKHTDCRKGRAGTNFGKCRIYLSWN